VNALTNMLGRFSVGLANMLGLHRNVKTYP